MEKVKRQKAKVGGAGSFFNQLMSNNSTVPEIGKGATQIHYSDRTCYEVVEVSEDGKTVKLQYLEASCDKSLGCGEGHQNWILTPTDSFMTVTWRHNAWRIASKIVDFTNEYRKNCEENGIEYIGLHLRKNNPTLSDLIYDGNIYPYNVVEGYTEEKTVYSKINIIFGQKNYYYDWEF